MEVNELPLVTTFYFFFSISSSSQEKWDREKKIKIIGCKKSEGTAEMSFFFLTGNCRI